MPKNDDKDKKDKNDNKNNKGDNGGDSQSQSLDNDVNTIVESLITAQFNVSIIDESQRFF